MILEKSRKGPLTARIRNRYIHSAYDPEKEALQIIKSFTERSDYSPEKTIIVFEPALGYVLTELRKIQAPSRLIVLFYDHQFYEHCRSRGLLNDLACFYPESASDFRLFLQRALGKTDLRDILFFEIPSTASAFSDLHQNYQKQILEQLSIRQGSEMTGRHFALKWTLNGIRNFIDCNPSRRIVSIDSDLILTASGPSLEEHIEAISEHREYFVIAALPSSLAILRANEIVPDILFTSDPGFYAREHLRHLQPETIIIHPITAALSGSGNPHSAIQQNSFIENLLYRQGEVASFPEMGTVAATALFSLMRICRQTIYIAGLDFCMEDIKMHALPHSFTPFILKNESRFNPGYSSHFERAASMTDSIEGRKRFTKNMNTYTAWFRQQDFTDRILRLRPAAVALPLKEVDSIKPSLEGRRSMILDEFSNYPDRRERCSRVRDLGSKLRSLLRDYDENEVMQAQLTEFIRNVYPEIALNSRGDRLKHQSEKAELLLKIDHLINKMDRMSDG